MTNRNLLSLVLRISSIYLFTKVFDHIGANFLMVYGGAMLSYLNESAVNAMQQYHTSVVFLTIANIIVSIFIFLKANWIATKIVKEDTAITWELNPTTLTKTILLVVGVVWLAQCIYKLPTAIEFNINLVRKLFFDHDTDKKIEFAMFPYLVKIIISLLLLFRIEKITRWIVKKI